MPWFYVNRKFILNGFELCRLHCMWILLSLQKNLMVVGIDVYHDSTFGQKKSVVGFVASNNKWVSCVMLCSPPGPCGRVTYVLVYFDNCVDLVIQWIHCTILHHYLVSQAHEQVVLTSGHSGTEAGGYWWSQDVLPSGSQTLPWGEALSVITSPILIST